MTSHAACDFEQLLANLERSSHRQHLHAACQFVERPFVAASIELQQLVIDRQVGSSEILFGTGLVLFQVAHDVQRAIHSSPMTWVSANVGIDAWLRRSFKAEGLVFAWLKQLTGQQNLVRLGNVMPLHGIRIATSCLGQFADLCQRSWHSDGEVMWHGIGV